MRVVKLLILVGAICIFILSSMLYGQNKELLTLSKCYEEARKNHPLFEQLRYLEEASRLKLRNLTFEYLPRLSIGGQASYQSDVTKINLDFGTIPGLPTVNIPIPPKDQYMIDIELKQIIYDGGIISASKDVETKELAVAVQNLEVEFYKIKDRINQIFFSILLQKEQEKILNSVLEDLRERKKVVESCVKNGILVPSDLNNIDAKMLQTEQQIIETRSAIEANCRVLSELTGIDVSTTTQLQLPIVNFPEGGKSERPENRLFRLQSERIDAAEKLLARKKFPRLMGFGRYGYGRPGLNMLSNRFDTFYVVGLRLDWEIWNWGENSRQQQILQAQKGLIGKGEELFNKNQRIVLEKEEAVVKNYEKIIEKDNQIVRLRERILKAARSKLKNGVITSSDYVNELNRMLRAELNLNAHRIRLIKSKINCLIIKGEL